MMMVHKLMMRMMNPVVSVGQRPERHAEILPNDTNDNNNFVDNYTNVDNNK